MDIDELIRLLTEARDESHAKRVLIFRRCDDDGMFMSVDIVGLSYDFCNSNDDVYLIPEYL